MDSIERAQAAVNAASQEIAETGVFRDPTFIIAWEKAGVIINRFIDDALTRATEAKSGEEYARICGEIKGYRNIINLPNFLSTEAQNNLQKANDKLELLKKAAAFRHEP